jgi:RND family efflux transporter MFP subunit
MIAKLKQLWAGQHRQIAVIAVVVASSAGTIGAMHLATRAPAIATAEVKLAEFVDSLDIRGEVHALKSASISAAADAGDLRIIKITTDGAQVKKGDVIVQFDKTKTRQDLAQFRSALKSAQAEIEQTRAQARLLEEEDLTAVMKARYNVESAKLEASKQEIVSAIEGKEANLKLADAEQKLREAERKQKSDRVANNALVESNFQASRKALSDMQRAERALGEMTLSAPSNGIVALVQNWRPDGQASFRPGDRVWPGALLAELPDVSTLRVSSRVDETERGRLRTGQLVNVQLDAIPDAQFTGRIDQISTIATLDFTGGWPFPRNFDLQVTLDQSDVRIRPGMTAQLTIVVDRVPNAITIPKQASFQKSGRTVAYVLNGSKFDERVLEVARRSRDRLLVAKGLRAGERIALKDPTAKE